MDIQRIGITEPTGGFDIIEPTGGLPVISLASVHADVVYICK